MSDMVEVSVSENVKTGSTVGLCGNQRRRRAKSSTTPADDVGM